MYTKYTYVHNVTKWLFYDFYFVSYMVYAYVYGYVYRYVEARYRCLMS